MVTPEFSEPILDQKITIGPSKIRSVGIFSSGTCKFTCKFAKDVLMPNESINLVVDIDNSACSKKIEKYKIKLLKRTQVLNVKNRKPIYTNDQVLTNEKIVSKCSGNNKETQTFVFEIPDSLFIDQDEAKRIKIPMSEKALSYGPSSSMSG